MLHRRLKSGKEYLESFSNHTGNVFAHLAERVSTMADEIVFTFQSLGIRLVCTCSPGCVRPSKSFSFGSEIRGNERCCVCGYRRARVLPRVHASGSVRRHESEILNWNVWCQRTASAVCLPTASPLSPSQHMASAKKKCAFGVVCACWCVRVHMALRACICVSGLITQRLGFVTLGYCEHSCAHPVMCHGLMEKERQRRHIRTSAGPFHLSYLSHQQSVDESLT